MPSTHLVRHSLHPADELLAMVADVESYPEFINLISALRITKKITDTDFEAEAVVAYKFLRETFKSKVSVDPAARTIRVFKADAGGAVKTLENFWKFHALEDGSTIIEFEVDVSLKAFPLNMLVREKMGRATEVLLASFDGRAKQVCKAAGSKDLDIEAQCQALGIKIKA